MSPSTSVGEVEERLSWFRLNNPSVQILLCTTCIAFNPGFYLALSLLGAGGGQASSIQMGNITNGVLYGIFAFSSVLAGSMLNILGPRTMLLFSCTGYPVFNGAMWYFSSTGHLWYPIFAGAYLGLAAGCLWTTAVFMCVGYPEEKDKGRWRAIGWTGNLIGSTIGASVALGIAWHSSTDSVPSSLYITFIVLQVFSLAFALLIQPPEKLRRCDGTAIARFNPISIKETLKLTAELFRDWRIWLLVPAMFTPEMSFPFQATMNGYAFNIRTRTLNSLLNGLVQIPVVALVGWILDRQSLGTRRKRLLIAITFVAVWLTGTYIAQTAWLAAWKFDLSVPGPQIDCTDPAYAGAVVVYLLYAAQYGGFQSVVLYTLSCFTNDPQKSAAIGGLYVGILSVGTAVCFALNATAIPFEHINGALFALTTISWPVLYYVAYNCTTDTNYGKEKTVVIPVHVRRELDLADIDDGAGEAKRTSTDSARKDPVDYQVTEA